METKYRPTAGYSFNRSVCIGYLHADLKSARLVGKYCGLVLLAAILQIAIGMAYGYKNL